MSLRGVDNEGLDAFGREDDEQHLPPNNWEEESPADSQELRWENDERDMVLWVESETGGGSPYAIFLTDYNRETDEYAPAEVVEKGLEDLDRIEVEAVKIMEDLEERMP